MIRPAGYSYLQILLVVALLAILAAAASPYYVRWQQQQRVQSTALVLRSDLQSAQTKAMQRYHNDTWGIRIHDSAKTYIIFRGSSYNAADSYNYAVSYPNSISISPDQDIVFTPTTGALDSATSLALTIASTGTPTESASISINAQGLID